MEYGPKRIVNLVDRAGIDDIFVQVYANGETMYPSRILKTNTRFTGGRDPLRTIISEAHQHHIKVHAWLNVFYIWSYSPRPADPNHPLYANWEVCDREGLSINSYSPSKLKRLGIEGYYISPSNPSYQKLFISIIDELINNYNIDGIHLDYIRYPGLDFGYDLMSRTSFYRRYYFDPQMISEEKMYSIMGSDSKYQIELTYRMHLIKSLSDFVKAITDHVHLKGDIPVSAAVKPNPDPAREQFGQDWLNWLASAGIDFVILMSYTPNTNWIIKVVSKLPYQDRIRIGVGTYLQDKTSIEKQITKLRRKGYKDLVIFSFEDIRKRPWLISSLH